MPSALLWQWRNSIEDNYVVDDSDDDLLTPNLPEIRPHAQHLLHPFPPLQPIHQSFNKWSSYITISKSVGENTKARSFCLKIWKELCGKEYYSWAVYFRCDRVPGWLHGGAVQPSQEQATAHCQPGKEDNHCCRMVSTMYLYLLLEPQMYLRRTEKSICGTFC